MQREADQRSTQITLGSIVRDVRPMGTAREGDRMAGDSRCGVQKPSKVLMTLWVPPILHGRRPQPQQERMDKEEDLQSRPSRGSAQAAVGGKGGGQLAADELKNGVQHDGAVRGGERGSDLTHLRPGHCEPASKSGS